MYTAPGSDVLLAYPFAVAEMTYREDDEAYTPGPSLAPAAFMVLGEAPGMYLYNLQSRVFFYSYSCRIKSWGPQNLSCLGEVDIDGDSDTDAATEQLSHVRQMMLRASLFSSVKWSHLSQSAL